MSSFTDWPRARKRGYSGVMRAQRIMAGFLHVGAGLAVICWVPGIFYLAVRLAGVPNDGLVAATTVRHGMLFGAVSCVTSTILGWIVANLVGDARS